jgi:hypothetical protein
MLKTISQHLKRRRSFVASKTAADPSIAFNSFQIKKNFDQAQSLSCRECAGQAAWINRKVWIRYQCLTPLPAGSRRHARDAMHHPPRLDARHPYCWKEVEQMVVGLCSDADINVFATFLTNLFEYPGLRLLWDLP